MTRTDLVNRVSKKLSCSKVTAKVYYDAVMESVVDALRDSASRVEEDCIKIYPLGKLMTRMVGPKKGRNPRTGQPLDIGRSFVMTFRGSPTLKDELKDLANKREAAQNQG